MAGEGVPYQAQSEGFPDVPVRSELGAPTIIRPSDWLEQAKFNLEQPGAYLDAVTKSTEGVTNLIQNTWQNQLALKQSQANLDRTISDTGFTDARTRNLDAATEQDKRLYPLQLQAQNQLVQQNKYNLDNQQTTANFNQKALDEFGSWREGLMKLDPDSSTYEDDKLALAKQYPNASSNPTTIGMASQLVNQLNTRRDASSAHALVTSQLNDLEAYQKSGLVDPSINVRDWVNRGDGQTLINSAKQSLAINRLNNLSESTTDPNAKAFANDTINAITGRGYLGTGGDIPPPVFDAHGDLLPGTAGKLNAYEQAAGLIAAPNTTTTKTTKGPAGPTQETTERVYDPAGRMIKETKTKGVPFAPGQGGPSGTTTTPPAGGTDLASDPDWKQAYTDVNSGQFLPSGVKVGTPQAQEATWNRYVALRKAKGLDTPAPTGGGQPVQPGGQPSTPSGTEQPLSMTGLEQPTALPTVTPTPAPRGGGRQVTTPAAGGGGVRAPAITVPRIPATIRQPSGGVPRNLSPTLQGKRYGELGEDDQNLVQQHALAMGTTDLDAALADLQTGGGGGAAPSGSNIAQVTGAGGGVTAGFDLQPEMAGRVADWAAAVKSQLGLNVAITEGRRSVERSNALHQSGIIAAPGGASYHNFGEAIDYGFRNPDGGIDLHNENAYAQAEKLAHQFGLTGISSESGHLQNADYASWRDIPKDYLRGTAEGGTAVASAQRSGQPQISLASYSPGTTQPQVQNAPGPRLVTTNADQIPDWHTFRMGNATTFGLNYDGSIDRGTNARGAFGYNIRDPQLVGASLSVPEMMRAFPGEVWMQDGEVRMSDRLRQVGRSGAVQLQVTDPKSGMTMQMPLVDLGPAGSTGNRVDLTHAASHLFRTGGKSILAYRLVNPAGQPIMTGAGTPITASQVAA